MDLLNNLVPIVQWAHTELRINPHVLVILDTLKKATQLLVQVINLYDQSMFLYLW